MALFLNSNRVLAIACFILGGTVGYFVRLDPDPKIHKLQNEIALLQRELSQAKRLGVRERVPLNPASELRSDSIAGGSPTHPVESRAQKHTEQRLEEWVQKTAAERDEEYTRVFGELGVGASDIERIKSNLVELHRNANAAGDPLGQLVLARSAYDEEVRSILGEENYLRYRTYEATKPAVREYGMVEEYALNHHKFSLDPAYKDQLVQLISEAKAATTETWDGPYDPLPRPVAGTAAIQKLEDDYSALIEKTKILLESAATTTLPDIYLEILAKYYANKQTDAARSIAYWKLPFEERVKQIRNGQGR